MSRKGTKGSITVFLSLACILFLSLICAVVESARVQGAKAQAANITGMGTFSVLGEFERELLEKYDIFAVNGTYGSGSFKNQKITQKMEDYISYNADPQKNLALNEFFTFDPWNLELTQCTVEYALLTDNRGEPFYQQAVAYMKANEAVLVLDRVLEYVQDKDQIKENQKTYENSLDNNDQQLEQLEQEQKEREAAAAQEASQDTSGNIIVIEGNESGTNTVTEQQESSVENPLPIISSLRKGPIIRLVTGNKDLSEKTIVRTGYPSMRIDRSGSMEIEKKYSGIISNALFREYLMLHFTNYSSKTKGNTLDYQIEYILRGKDNDLSNLKSTVNELLLMREGMNFAYCLFNAQMNSEAEGLAYLLTAVLANPAISEATKYALLLAWSFGESLLDVRVLLNGGRIPLYKDSSTWYLSLNNLGQVAEILQSGTTNQNTGWAYDEYLRLLLNLEDVKLQRLRALDVIQSELRAVDGNSEFKVENCIAGVKAETTWECRPVFYSLPRVVLGVSSANMTFTQKSSMVY